MTDDEGLISLYPKDIKFLNRSHACYVKNCPDGY